MLPKWSLLVGVSLEGWILWGKVLLEEGETMGVDMLLEVWRIVAGGRVRIRIGLLRMLLVWLEWIRVLVHYWWILGK